MFTPVNVFIDDTRACPDGAILFRSGEEFLFWLEKNRKIDHISLDYFLGKGKMTGEDIISSFPYYPNLDIHEIAFHTDNPIGKKRMYKSALSLLGQKVKTIVA